MSVGEREANPAFEVGALGSGGASVEGARMSEQSSGTHATRRRLMLVVGLLGSVATFAVGPGAALAYHHTLLEASGPELTVAPVGNAVDLNGLVTGDRFAVTPPDPTIPAGGSLPVTGASRLSNIFTVGFVLLSLGSFVMLARRRRPSKG